MRLSKAANSLVAVLTVIVTLVGGGALECSRPRTSMEAKGEHAYAQMCAVCHGKGGEGYAADHAPALANPDFLSSVTDDFLRKAIENGRAGSTMSAWSRSRGGPISSTEVDALIVALRSWGPRTKATLDDSRMAGDAAKGAPIFARECASCHGEKGLGGTFEQIGNPELLTSASDGFLRYAIRRGRSAAGMPSFKSKLGDASIEDVIAHLRALQAAAPPSRRPAAAKAPPIPLGAVPLNAKGPEPVDFHQLPQNTGADVIKRELDRGAKMAILDARAPSDYMNEHIAGSVSVPFYDPAPYYSQLPKDSWIVCYCACPHAESGQLAAKLVGQGFTRVTVLDEGLGYWRNHKYPTHTGLEP